VSRAAADKVRKHIDRGLARYEKGELREALAEWEQALVVDPDNSEARSLVEFADARLSGQHEIPGKQRPTERALSPLQEWTREEDTNPDGVSSTPLGSMELDDELTGPHRVRRSTVESPIPGLLAQATDPLWGSGLDHEPPAEREEGAPETPLDDENTRRVGSEPHATLAGRVPSHSSMPVADLNRAARMRASQLIDECRGHLERGDFEGAVAAAESALSEGEHAPLPGIPEVIEPARPLFERAFEGYVGPHEGVPEPAMSPAALAGQELDHRAGFLFSRIDGAMAIEHLLDIAGMPRFEALRIFSGLLRVKAIRIR
jgi:hypothetical protein